MVSSEPWLIEAAFNCWYHRCTLPHIPQYGSSYGQGLQAWSILLQGLGVDWLLSDTLAHSWLAASELMDWLVLDRLVRLDWGSGHSWHLCWRHQHTPLRLRLIDTPNQLLETSLDLRKIQVSNLDSQDLHLQHSRYSTLVLRIQKNHLQVHWIRSKANFRHQLLVPAHRPLDSHLIFLGYCLHDYHSLLTYFQLALLLAGLLFQWTIVCHC